MSALKHPVATGEVAPQKPASKFAMARASAARSPVPSAGTVASQSSAPAPDSSPTPASAPLTQSAFAVARAVRPAAPQSGFKQLFGRTNQQDPNGPDGFAGRQQVGTRPSQPKKAEVDPNAVQVLGKINRILFNDESSGRALMLVTPDKGGPNIKLEGALTFKPEVGRRVSALAVPEEHPKYGVQYKADLVVEEVPTDRLGAVTYMTRVLKGVDRALASKIYDAFGLASFEVLTQEPRRFLGIGGITNETLPAIVASWAEDTAVRGIWTFLGRHGISGAVAHRIYAKFGARALQVAKETPYELTTVEGVGFVVADQIAAEGGLGGDSAERIAGAIEYALEHTAQQGHTAMRMSVLVSEVQELTQLESDSQKELIEAAIATRVEQRKLVARTLDGHICLSTAEVVAAEQSIARRIQQLMAAGSPDPVLSSKARSMSASLKDDIQANAVANVFDSAVSVITGRPGCGKTTVVKVIKDVAKAAGLQVVMVAPTGKAARRMSEATGEPASTIHSALKPANGSLEAFEHYSGNPLEGDIFVVDESSMKDTAITRSLLAAIPDGARLVLVGDSDQLPSVGAGNVLHDLIASGKVPVTRLQTIHRTAMNSDIVVNAHKVINGDANGVDLAGKKDFTFNQASSDKDIQDSVLRHYLDMVAEYGVDSVQILAARRATAVGVRALNALIRPVINPASPAKTELEHRGNLWRLGDRVMRTSNNAKLGVSNGEVGIITHIDVDKKRIRINFGDRVVLHEGKDLLALDLAYATTIHKSQGSEYDGVIMVTPGSHRGMLNRNLLYTGMTRGKKHSKVIGDEAVFRAGVRRQGSKRSTGLVAELVARFGGPSPAASLPGAALPLASPPPHQTSLLDGPNETRLSARAPLFKRSRP